MINAGTVQQSMQLQTPRKLGVGTHEKCKVTSIEIGDNYIDFNYEHPESNAYGNKRVYFPDITKVYPREYTNEAGEKVMETPAMALVRDTNQKAEHLVGHAAIFLTPEQIAKIVAPDFPSFAKMIKAVLDPVLDTQYVNLLCIYDSDGRYSTFGNYFNYIERWEEGKPCSLQPSKWEAANRMTRKEQPKVDVDNSNQSGIY